MGDKPFGNWIQIMDEDGAPLIPIMTYLTLLDLQPGAYNISTHKVQDDLPASWNSSRWVLRRLMLSLRH